jgi:hypothetical protein
LPSARRTTRERILAGCSTALFITTARASEHSKVSAQSNAGGWEAYSTMTTAFRTTK